MSRCRGSVILIAGSADQRTPFECLGRLEKVSTKLDRWLISVLTTGEASTSGDAW